MSTRLCLSTAIGTLALFSTAASAQQALVRSYDNPSLEIGQAYLAHYGDRCLAILPTHVASESGNVAALLKEGTSPLLGETAAYAALGDDISVADVTGAIRGDCGFSTVAVSRAVQSRIRANAVASVRSVNGDGSIAQLSVTIIDDDGSLFLRVQPTNDTNQLRKGQSGSLLIAGDTPIGMLLSVDPRFGAGKVIRLDAMLDKVDRHLASGTAPDSASQQLETAANEPAGKITQWTAVAAGAEHRATNLVATDDSPPWIANVSAWPVEIELELPGGRLALAGIALDGTGIADAGMLPATVELLISSTEKGRRWRSVAGGSVTYSDGRALFEIAPSWVRHVKLVISETGNGANTVALRRLELIPAP